MLRNWKGKVVVSLSLSIITVLSLFVPMAQALQANTALETTIQGKWQAILDADLTVGDATEQTDDLSSEETVTDISPGPDLKAEPLEEEDLAGARYIVVYKTVAEKQNVLGKLAHSSKQDKVLKRLDNQKVDLLVYNRDVEKQQVVEDLQEDGVVVDYVQLDYEVFMSSWQDGGEGTDVTETSQDDWTAFYGNLAEAHEETTGAGVTVALLDGGVETTHSALAGAFYTNTAEIAGNGVDDDGNGYVDDVSGWDFVNRDNTVNDAAWAYEQGHSTHLAGILVGQGDVQGIAPAAGILPLKIFQNGVAYTSDILEAISYSESMGAQIANCSWGGGYYNRALYEAMENSEMLFVTAAGNSVRNLNTYPVYPACFDLPNVLTVSSVGSDEKHSHFSNYGNQVVDVAAPGYKITSSWTEGSIVPSSGTSQATAVVSGQAALVLSQQSSLSAEQLKEHIVSTADEVTGLSDKVKDGKRVNVAFSLSGQEENTTVIDVPDEREWPDVAPGETPETDAYEQYGADHTVTYKASMPTARHGLGVVAVNGLIYAIGGQGGSNDNEFFKRVDVYDPVTDSWTRKTDMNTARSYFGIAVLNEKIYVFGGKTSASGTTSSVEMYNPATNTWANKTLMPTARYSLTANAYDGNIYIAGGYSTNAVYKYNAANDTWLNYGSLTSVRYDHSAYVYGGKLYVDGGSTGSSSSSFYNITVEEFDLSTKGNSAGGQARTAGMNAAVDLDEKRFITAGGSKYKGGGTVDAIIERDVSEISDYFMKVNKMNTARSGLGGVFVDGTFYMIGGINRDRNLLFDTVEALELGYKKKASPPKTMRNFKTVELGGNVYTLGGEEYSSGSYTYIKRFYEYNSLSNVWTSLADLPTYCRNFAVTSAYGKIYIMGGETSVTATGSWTSSAVIREYNPQSNTWTTVTPTITNTTSFTHAATWAGEIYAAANGYTTMKKFNPITKELSSLASRPSATTITNICVMDNKLFVFGSSGVQIYDFSTAQWSTKSNYFGNLIAPVYDTFYMLHGTTTPDYQIFDKYSHKENIVSTYQSFNYYGIFHQICTVNNKIYIFAGNSNAANTLIEYMPPVTPWTERLHSVNDLFAYMGGSVIGEKAYIVGGYEIPLGGGDETLRNKLYEISGDSHTEKSPMPTARAKMGVVEVNGKLYVIGGEVAKNQSASKVGTATNQVHMYDPTNNTWTAKASLPVAAHSMAAASYNGKIYIFGGTGSTYTYEYNPNTNAWTQKASMSSSIRYGCGAAVIGNKIYVVGGIGSGSQQLRVYDPGEDNWETKTDLPSSRSYFGIAAAGENIYVIGGNDGYSDTATVLVYNSIHDQWYEWPGIHMSLQGLYSMVYNGGIYAIGGMSFYQYSGSDAAYYYSHHEYAPISSLTDEYIHFGDDYINPSGNLSRSYVDLSYPAAGFDVQFSRTYNSRDTRTKDLLLGTGGWTFGFQGKVESSGNDTVVRLPDSSVISFKAGTNGTFTAKDSRTTLVKNSDDTYKLTTKDQYSYDFNTAGYLVKMNDPNGNAITITVDSTGRPTSVQDQSGRTATIAYTGSCISSITDAASRQAVYSYTNNRLSSIKDPSGYYTYYTYDTNGYLASVKDHNQNTIESFTHEVVGQETLKKLKTSTTAYGNTITYKYDWVEGSVKTQDSNGRTETTYFDKALYPIRIIDAGGRQSRVTYHLDNGINRWGERASETDRNENTTYYEYDANGNVTKVVNPDMGFRTYTYDSKNNVTKEVDEEGQTTYYQYDTKGNMTLKAKRKAGTQDYSSSATQSNFEISKYTYNSQGFMTAEQPAGYSLMENGDYVYQYAYNSYGQVKEKSRNIFHSISQVADMLVDDKYSVQSIYTYNNAGFLMEEKVTEAEEYCIHYPSHSSAPQMVSWDLSSVQYYYDKNGRLLKTVNADDGIERIVYDVFGRVTKTIAPRYYNASYDTAAFDTQHIATSIGGYSATANTTRYNYNSNGTLASEVNPAGYTTTYNTYDMYGKLVQKTMPNGAVYLYTYDNMDRLTAERFKETSSSSTVTLFTYSYGISQGKTTQTTYRYLTSSATAATTDTYDWAGRLLTRQHPTGGGTETNIYYQNGLLQSATDVRGFTSLYKYDVLGRMTERRIPTINNTTYALTQWTYNTLGEVASESRYLAGQTATSTSGTAVTASYSYDTKTGWMTGKTDNAGRNVSYVYDRIGNVKREQTLISTENYHTIYYEYDSMNRRTKKTEYLQTRDTTAGSTSTTSVSLETVYTYDLNGNLLTETPPNNITTTYTYDAMNRQTGVSYPNYNESNSSVTVTTSQTYNNMGLVSMQTDERGKVTSLSYDKRGRLLSTTYPDGGIAAYAYDVGGRMIAQVSPENYESGKTADQMSYQTVYTYDAMDRVKTTGFKKSTTTTTLETLTYDNAGNVLTRKNAMNNTTSYAYDAAGRLVTTTHPSSLGTNTNAYDALGRVTQNTNEKGVVSQYTYDYADNLLTQSVATTAGAVTVLTNTYDKLGNVLTSTDANGSVTTNTYNEMGWLRTTTLPGDDSISANMVTYCYDKMGNIVNTRDSLSREQVYTYDNMGRVRTAKEQQVGGTQAITTSTRYDKAGNPIYVYDGRSNMTTYTYDNRNRVLTVKNPKNQTTTYTYDLNGNNLSETDWRGNKYEYVYDERDRLVEKRDPFKDTANPQGNLIELLEYDNNDRQIKSTDALGHSKTFAYDARGRLLSTTESLTSTVSYTTSQTYDGVGNVLTRTDGNGKATRLQYDEFNRLTTVKDHNNVLLSSYTYDGAGNQLTQTDGEGRTTTTAYNARSLPVTRSDPDGEGEAAKTVSLTYRADGSVATETDRNGVTTTYTYDIHGRILSKAAGDSTTSYTYDANANLLTMVDNTGTTTRTYDALNRVLTKTAPNTGTITYTYDVTSGMAAGTWGEQSVDTKGNTVVKVYDQAGRLSQVKHASQTTVYAYLDNGALQKVTYPGGAYEEYTYYDDNKLHTLTNKKANGTIIDAYNYAYDGAGNRTQILDGHGTTTYTYDVLNRLLTATEPDGRVTAYTYDGSGNRISETVTQSGQSVTTTYQYNEQNRLTATETEQPDDTVRLVDFYYDNNGNMVGRTSALLTDGTSAAVLSLSETEDEAALYDYDVWNNMVSSTVDGETTTHIYNGDNLRVSKTANGLTTRYAYEYTEVVLELDGSGNQKALNVRGHKLLSRVTSAGSSWFMYNGHGDVTALVDGTNTAQATYYYDAFGVHKEQTGTADNPYRYSGYTFDEESGLYYLKSRFYDPELARFMQEDTYRGDPVDPLSLNLYTYCVNNPIQYYDPTGFATATLTNGQTVNCTIVNGVTYMPDGSRPTTGTVVHADNGIDYQMTESGKGVEVPKGSTGVAVSTTSGTQAGLLNNGSTTMTVTGDRPSNGSVVHTPQGGDYMMVDGKGQKVTPTTVYVPVENSARYTPTTGYIDQSGLTHVVGGSRPTNGSVVNTSGGQYVMIGDTSFKANLTQSITKNAFAVTYNSTLSVYYPNVTATTTKSTTELRPMNEIIGIVSGLNNKTNFLNIEGAYGGNQGWFEDILSKPLKANSGCPSIAAANLLLYYAQTNYGGIGSNLYPVSLNNASIMDYRGGGSNLYSGSPNEMTSDDFIKFADMLYDMYVPQAILGLGVWSMSALESGIKRYAGRQGIDLQSHRNGDSSSANMATFIRQGLNTGSPVALFVGLNSYAHSLHKSGTAAEKHFMTITGISETSTATITRSPLEGPSYLMPDTHDYSLSISTWGRNTIISSLNNLLDKSGLGGVSVSYFTVK